MAARIAAHHWAGTPLGAVQSWSPALRTSVSICLESRHPMVLWWGPELVLLYNDAWIPILGHKHPALGLPGHDVWPETWHIIGPQLAGVLDTGVATWSDDQLLPVCRHGYLEEAYFTYSYSAIRDDDGRVGGVFTAVTETTSRVLAQRRLATLSSLGSRSGLAATSVEGVCTAVVQVLAGNRLDVPFGVVYLVDGDGDARRTAAFGTTDGGAGFPRVAARDPARSVWRAISTGRAQIAEGLSARLPGAVSPVDHPVGEAVPDAALVVPLTSPTRTEPTGVVVLGINPYRALDEEYRSFLELVAAQLSTAVAETVAHEQERRRVADARLVEAQQAFALLTEQTDDVLARHDLDGTYRYVSPSVHRLSGYRPADLIGRDPFDLIPAEDHDQVRESLARVVADGAGTITMRLRHADGSTRWIESRARVARDDTGRAQLHTTSRDVTDRVRSQRELGRSEQALHEQQERYRLLVAQAPVGIFLTDAAGAHLYANDRLAALAGRPAATLRGTGWVEAVHPSDRERVARSWLAAVRADTDWAQECRLAAPAPDGAAERWIAASAQPLRDTEGTRTGYLGVCIDVTERRRAEQDSRAVAAEQAARAVSEAAAARLRAMVDGLAAILWEVDVATLRFTFVSERAQELLGYPAAAWLDDPDFWPGIIHPADRDRARSYCAEQTAAGNDHDFTYRVLTADGTVVWLHDLVHVVCDPDGTPTVLQGVMIDVTVQQRAERAAALLAESGRLLGGATPPEQRLDALAGLLVPELAELVVVAVVGDDGRSRRVAVAHPDPAVATAIRELPAEPIAAATYDRLTSGHPVPLPITEATLGILDDPGGQEPPRPTLAVPLLTAGQLIGILGLVGTAGRPGFDAADRDLAEELGRRAARMVQAERTLRQQRQLQRVATELAAAATVAEAAEYLAAQLSEALDATASSVFLGEPDGLLRMAYAVGYPEELTSRYPVVRLDERVPFADCVRTGDPVWLGDRDEWDRRYPDLAAVAARPPNLAAACLPLRASGRIIGGLALSFGTPRRFTADERAFIMALVAQAGAALDRAVVADQRRHVAETLQHSLLPRSLPVLDRLALAAHYLPGTAGVAAGGDWYDVLALDADRVAVVVGDVVGQGAGAAAVMGQLRSALAAYLLDGHGPGAALDRLDRFAATVEGALGSTAICVVLDQRDGAVCWARAGHLPPLVVDRDGARFLDGATGTVLGVPGRPPSTESTARLPAGAAVLVYTDGLVERRTEVIDTGLDRLAEAAGSSRHHGVTRLATGILERCLAGSGPADDVALILARRRPPPLELAIPPRPDELRRVRVALASWAASAGLAPTVLDDLQLAVGEAVANSVEHAFPAGAADGATVRCRVHRPDGGPIEVRVTDTGRWRSPPADPGDRGRGLALIRAVARDVSVDGGPAGSTVGFTIDVPEAATDAPDTRQATGGSGRADRPGSVARGVGFG